MQKHRRARVLSLVLLAAAFWVEAPTHLQPQSGAPEVIKVEPPNWWVGHSINPVRVMVRGRRLDGARVAASGTGLTVGRVRVNPTGTYLFADVIVSPSAKPGPRSLKITARGGVAEAPFEVLPPLHQDVRLQGFSPDDVIYLLMPDRFSDGDPSNDDPAKSRGLFDRQKSHYYHGGDFQGIINHLPYLKDLGVTAIWMTPIYDNSDRLATFNNEGFTSYHGYGAVDFYGVEEHFGSMETLRALVDAAHRVGLKVIQDEVANHTGPDHPWVQDPPTPTWFNGTAANHINETWQTWTLMDPHASPALQKSTLEGWFANMLPDLNQDDEECARYLIQNTLWWIGMAGFDGIRQDTLPYVPRHFWREWMTAIKRQYPHFAVVGEMWDGDPALVSFFQGGIPRFDGIDTKVDSVFDFPLCFAIRKDFAEGKSIRDLAVTLAHDYLYPNSQELVTFIGNHDLPRFMNDTGASLEGLELADTFLMTARGIPSLYYGDEIAMRGGNDPDNRRDFPGGWPNDMPNAFAAAGRSTDQQAVFEHLRRLTHLRAELEPLRQGKMINLELSDQTYVYARVTMTQAVIVAINNRPQAETVEFSVADLHLPDGSSLRDLLGAGPETIVQEGKIKLNLPARTAGVYAVKD